ncbi:MAG: glucan biosynthesis protein G, partial [Pseudomonadota bacterium]|nr:glucan biosynthesis protein G [Pseudomonadota bacterium]
MSRLLLATFGLLLTLLSAAPACAFGLDDVAAIAAREASAPYRASPPALPAELAALDYDAMRDIRYRSERAVWRDQGLPFELQFFHLGRNNRQPVQINQIVGGQVQPIHYDPAAWTFGKNRLNRNQWGDIGYAGFRVHTALNQPGVRDELIVFLGASYFRALGQGQRYGLSARALAIDTVDAPPGQGEEFPRFTTFWIERPAANAKALVIYALLDSPSAAGAYRFTVTPGAETVIEVEQRLYLRGPVARLGIAPLTSMYSSGENQPQPGDFRPEVHDSDGLMVQADGEALWRPLVNPSTPLVSSFSARSLLGYGLMQRDRNFASYEDDEAHYERRPSAWVEPVGDWGPGRVELLQLHTPDETHDNIVAYWVPATQPAPGTPLALSYRLHWQGDAQQMPAAAHVVQSRRGLGWKRAGDRSGDLQF